MSETSRPDRKEEAQPPAPAAAERDFESEFSPFEREFFEAGEKLATAEASAEAAGAHDTHVPGFWRRLLAHVT